MGGVSDWLRAHPSLDGTVSLLVYLPLLLVSGRELFHILGISCSRTCISLQHCSLTSQASFVCTRAILLPPALAVQLCAKKRLVSRFLLGTQRSRSHIEVGGVNNL